MHFSIQALMFWSAVRGQVALTIKCYFSNRRKFRDLTSFPGRRPVLSLQLAKIGVKLVPAYGL